MDEDGIPATQEAVSNPKLELKLYGPVREKYSPGWQSCELTNAPEPLDRKHDITFSGDLTARGQLCRSDGIGSKLRWVTRTSGFHVVRPVVKLADKSWLVGDIISALPVI
jgi:hypothetical protein